MSAVCPYCRCPFEPDDTKTICPGCDTPHHTDCFEENGGCTVFGCSHAPGDEPILHVSTAELVPAETTPSLSQTADANAVVAAVTAPPPPLLSSITPPPPPMVGVAQIGAVQRPIDGAPPLSLAEVYAGVQAHKSRTTFVLLGIFLGIFGVHNFYAGYARKGAAQLCLTVFTCFYGAIMSEIWAIVEVCIVSHDGDGQDFH